MKTPHIHPLRHPARRVFNLRLLLGSCLALLAGLYTGNSSLNAQYTYTQSFASPVGGLPDDWQVAGYFDSGVGIAEITATLPALYQARTAAGGGANGNSTVYFTGDFGTVSDGILADFSSTMVFRIGYAANGPQGVVLRGSISANGNGWNGYYISFNEDTNILQIGLNPTAVSGAGSLGSILESTTISSGLSHDVDYLLSVSAVEDTISASIYGWDSETSSYSLPLGEVSAIDSTYSEGLFGFRTSYGGINRAVSWRNLELTTIPEPSTATMILGAAGFLVLMRIKFCAVRK